MVCWQRRLALVTLALATVKCQGEPPSASPSNLTYDRNSFGAGTYDDSRSYDRTYGDISFDGLPLAPPAVEGNVCQPNQTTGYSMYHNCPVESVFCGELRPPPAPLLSRCIPATPWHSHAASPTLLSVHPHPHARTNLTSAPPVPQTNMDTRASGWLVPSAAREPRTYVQIFKPACPPRARTTGDPSPAGPARCAPLASCLARGARAPPAIPTSPSRHCRHRRRRQRPGVHARLRRRTSSPTSI